MQLFKQIHNIFPKKEIRGLKLGTKLGTRAKLSECSTHHLPQKQNPHQICYAFSPLDFKTNFKPCEE